MKIYFEQIAWAMALLFLYFVDIPKEAGSFCIFKLIGFQSCPGCGIGHAIHYALHFDWAQSFHAHVLGIPATLAIAYLITKPFFSNKNKTIHYEPAANAYDASRSSAR
ncbi:MAG: DUF2752 domain-containing protein [Bacteroidetes bacterium]|jgi:hypothetical protein|nr:DUF2752 domain-containing protein [Bacteroidota bacterium]